MNKVNISTKDKIVEKTTELILKKGYSGFSISDIMAATGLQKGGIYNHFTSKKEIALLAMQEVSDRIRKIFSQKVQAEKSGLENLIAFIETFYSLNNHSDFSDSYPFSYMSNCEEREIEQQYNEMFYFVKNILNDILSNGVQDKIFRQGVQTEELTIYILSSIHGSILLSKNTSEIKYMEITKRKVIQFCTKELL